MNAVKSFKDTCGIQGWVEYLDNFGNPWRRHDDGCVYHFYEYDDCAFIHHGCISHNSRLKSIQKIHKAYRETCD